MSQSDVANALNRMAPGAPGSSPAKMTFVNGANAAVAFRTVAAGSSLQAPVYISVKTTSGVCLAFGPSGVAVPTTNDPRFDSTDGWQDMIVPSGATHVRAFGDGAGGSLYIWLSGQS